MQYKILGSVDKKPFVILHWWWWSSESWKTIAEELSKKFFVILVDYPCGSKLLDCDKVYTLDDYVEDLKKLLDNLKIKKAIVFWHSNWWAIASKFAVKYPNYVEKLILNNSAWIRQTKQITFKRKFFKFLSKIFNFFKFIPWFEKIKNLFYRAIKAHDYLDAQKNPNKKQTFLNMINEDLKSTFEKISVDTLIIWWEKDTYTPLWQGKLIAKLIKKSKFVIIENVKHGIHLQNPKKLIEIILDNTKD